MKKRHVFSVADVTAAETCVHTALQTGVPSDDVSLIARDDIQLEEIPDRQQEPKEDFGRGAVKGILAGGGSGLLAGLVAITVTPIGLTLAGVAAMTLAGAATGSWMGMLTGTAEPDIVRRTFEDEIAAGHVLVVIDGEHDLLLRVDDAMASAGARHLPFEQPTAMS
jgi:hypothetical protein